MSQSENAVIVVATRWLTPLAVLFALTLLANWPAGVGVGFVAGAVMALPVLLNALIFGVSAVLRALPPLLLRAALALAFALALLGVGLPNFVWSAQLVEFGAFIATPASIALISLAVMGRAGALRDANW